MSWFKTKKRTQPFNPRESWITPNPYVSFRVCSKGTGWVWLEAYAPSHDQEVLALIDKDDIKKLISALEKALEEAGTGIQIGSILGEVQS